MITRVQRGRGKIRGEQQEQLSFYTSINMRVDEMVHLTGLVLEVSLGMFQQQDQISQRSSQQYVCT